MKLISLMDLDKGDIVSIVGAGGKTTCLFTLAEELRRDYKCLLTTTTKIFVPCRNSYDFFVVGNVGLQKARENRGKGIYVYGSSINSEDKLIGIDTETLDFEIPYFDFILIEADGSKRKPVKGWNDTEPVICSKTTKTIGVLSIEAVGKVVNDDNIHRLKEFIKISDAVENGVIGIKHIINMIFHPRGLFKGSAGEKILFINKVENDEQKVITEELLYHIKKRNIIEKLIDRIIIGSLKNNEYFIA